MSPRGQILLYRGICKMSRKIRYTKSESARKKITKVQINQINKVYNDAYNNLAKKAKALEGKKNISSKLRKLYLDDFMKDLSKEMANANSKVGTILKDGAKDVAKEVVKENNKLLKNIGINVVGAYSYVPDKAIMQIINGNVYNGQWTLSKALWGAKRKNIKAIEKIMQQSLAENKPIKEVVKELMKYSKSGNAKYNAYRLARTMTNHAYQKAFQMTTEKNPFIEAYQWNNGHADTDVCDLCKELAETDGFGLGPGVFPKNEIPMDHPNGYCFITAIAMDDKQMVQCLADWVNGEGDLDMNKALDEFSEDMGLTSEIVKNNVKI